MAHTAQRARLRPERLREIQGALRERGLDGWLLYDYHATNAIAGRVLGLPQPLTRRYFALIPAEGKPVAVAPVLEQTPWKDWPGPVRSYLAWQELETALGELLSPGLRIAVEYSEGDKVPQIDRVPAGVLDLIKRAGVHLVESSELVTLFAAAWSKEELESHRRAAVVLARVAARAFERAVEAVRNGDDLSEWGLKRFILGALAEDGLVEGETIVAVGPNAADGHYEPTAERSRMVVEGQVLLIDLWAREEGSVFADQTWMGFMGADVPGRVREVWKAVHAARVAAVGHVEEHWADADPPLRGAAVDRACRAVIEDAGFGGFFTHRTGHSIDNEVHGLGPNIDSVETKDERALLPGVGFSIEPGIYLPDEFGIRSEINVYIGSNGPQVTTPNPQSEIYALLSEGWRSSSNL